MDATLKNLASLANKTHDETLMEASVSHARLDELGRSVSDYVLGAENPVFPFTLKPNIHAVAHAGEPRSLAFSGVGKAPYTEPPLDSESSSLRASFSEHVAEAIGRDLVANYLTAANVTPLRGDSNFGFFEDMTTRAQTLRAQGYSPLLLVPAQQAPEWVSPWRYRIRADRQPENIPVQPRKSDDPPSVVAYFNDVPSHQVPFVVPHCYVVAREHFDKLIYENRTGSSCLSVAHTPQENHTIRIEFEWAFSTAPIRQ